MSGFLLKGSAAFLAVDLDEIDLGYLSQQERQTYENAVGSFSEAIRPYIDLHIWTAFSEADTFQFSRPALTDRAIIKKQKMIQKHGLLAHYIHHQDIIIDKSENNDAFDASSCSGHTEPSVLDRYLKKHYPKVGTIIIVGMSTEECILESIKGALKHNYHCIAVCDLVRQGLVPERTSEANASFLNAELRDQNENTNLEETFLCVSSTECLALLKENPAPPVRATPVSILQTRDFT